jgi:hypothetical protein
MTEDEALKTAQDAYDLVGKPVTRGKEKRTVTAVFARHGNAFVELTDKRGKCVTVTLGTFNKEWKVK